MLNRKRPARRAIDEQGNRANLVFVTICTKERKPILANPEVHSLLKECWSDSSQWMVGCYVIMPDHVHLFCAPCGKEFVNVRDWIAYWKSLSARHWPRSDQHPIWQREAWDRQLRSSESYSLKWEYVRGNPVRHKLVADPDEWPYQGELNSLTWHEP